MVTADERRPQGEIQNDGSIYDTTSAVSESKSFQRLLKALTAFLGEL